VTASKLAPLIQGALAHKGSAILDGIGPCVTFNNHDGSTKSLKYVKGHVDPIHDLDFVAPFENIEVDYEEGTDHAVELHDGRRFWRYAGAGVAATSLIHFSTIITRLCNLNTKGGSNHASWNSRDRIAKQF
jgi:hypothetical protein